MEDLSGDMEKALTSPTHPKPGKRSTRWTVLFVGDHGKIIRLQKFKGIAVAFGIASVITLTAAVCLGFFYNDEVMKNSLLETSLIESRQTIRSLRDEKDILLARVVVAESKRGLRKGKTTVTSEVVTVKKKEITEETLLPPAEPLPEKSAVKTAATVSVDAESENRPEIEAESAAVYEKSESIFPSDPSTLITIDDFFSIVEPDSNRLRIKYKIRNVDPNSNPVSGRTFLILKSKSKTPEQWAVLPDVELASGKPVNIKSGRSFLITRFKTIRFKAPYSDDMIPYETVTILVYAMTGELLFEKDFPIELNQIEPAPAG
jgi:hypothetical protein